MTPYSNSRIMRRCGQLGLTYREAITSPFFVAQGLVAPSLAAEHGEGVAGFVLIGGRLRPLDALRTLPHTIDALRAILGSSQTAGASLPIDAGGSSVSLAASEGAKATDVATLEVSRERRVVDAALRAATSEGSSTENLVLDDDVLDIFEFTPLEDQPPSGGPLAVPTTYHDHHWAPTLRAGFLDSGEGWDTSRLTPAAILGDGIAASGLVSDERDDEFLVRSQKGRKASRRGRRITGTRVGIDFRFCRTWCNAVAANGRCSMHEIRSLVSRCRGNVPFRDLEQNIVRALEEFGFQVREEEEAHDELWGAASDVDPAELYEAVDALLNWQIRLPGAGRFTMSRSREEAHLMALLTARQQLSQAILSHDTALNAALERRSSTSHAFMLGQWTKQGRVTHGKRWANALESFEGLQLTDMDREGIVAHATIAASNDYASIKLSEAMDAYLQALDDLKVFYLPLVRRFAARSARGKEDLEDVFQVAMEGLRRAVQLVKGTSAVRFRVYLAIWVRQSILKWRADHGDLCRRPLNRMADVERFEDALRACRKSRQFLGRRRHFVDYRTLGAELGWGTAKVDRFMSFLRDPVPLWEMDSVAEAHTWIPEHDLEGAELMEVIDTLLATLGEREAKILRLYHGLDGTETMTLEEIGSQLGVTRERVRQIKEKAMEKLLARGAAKLLSQYH
jgi:RNA polymerase primary sigma factor